MPYLYSLGGLPYKIHIFHTKRAFTCKRLDQYGTTVRSTQSYFCFPTFFPFGPNPYLHTLEGLPYKIQFFHTMGYDCTTDPDLFLFFSIFHFGSIPYLHSIVGLPYKIHILVNYPEKPPGLVYIIFPCLPFLPPLSYFQFNFCKKCEKV